MRQDRYDLKHGAHSAHGDVVIARSAKQNGVLFVTLKADAAIHHLHYRIKQVMDCFAHFIPASERGLAMTNSHLRAHRDRRVSLFFFTSAENDYRK